MNQHGDHHPDQGGGEHARGYRRVDESRDDRGAWEEDRRFESGEGYDETPTSRYMREHASADEDAWVGERDAYRVGDHDDESEEPHATADHGKGNCIALPPEHGQMMPIVVPKELLMTKRRSYSYRREDAVGCWCLPAHRAWSVARWGSTRVIRVKGYDSLKTRAFFSSGDEETLKRKMQPQVFVSPLLTSRHMVPSPLLTLYISTPSQCVEMCALTHWMLFRRRASSRGFQLPSACWAEHVAPYLQRGSAKSAHHPSLRHASESGASTRIMSCTSSRALSPLQSCPWQQQQSSLSWPRHSATRCTVGTLVAPSSHLCSVLELFPSTLCTNSSTGRPVW